MTTPISRHPDDATLMSYAAGTLGEALAAAIAAHVSMCGHCRAQVMDMEMLGGALLAGPGIVSDIEPSWSPPALKPTPPSAGASPGPACDRLPRPLSVRYGLTFDTIPWRRLAPGVWHHRFAVSEGAGDLRLLRISKGLRMPEHGHGGTELTLVLDGAYSDSSGQYLRGDLQDVDDEVEHRPIADAALGCVCLIASEHPARFKGLLGRVISPLTGL